MVRESRQSRPSRLFAALPVLIALGAGAGLAAPAAAFPEPSSVPYRWELEFEPGHVRLYVDPLDGSAFWYFTYVVTNRTESDQLWAPTAVLFTDEGEILAAGAGVPPRVEEDIRDLLGNDLLETQHEIIGELHQGREHARDGLVVWPARNREVNEMTLFIGGVSGETARILNPITGDEVILRKTLQRDYIVRGDAMARGSEPAEFVREQWVLR